MKIELNLYAPEEMRLFGEFLIKRAAAAPMHVPAALTPGAEQAPQTTGPSEIEKEVAAANTQAAVSPAPVEEAPKKERKPRAKKEAEEAPAPAPEPVAVQEQDAADEAEEAVTAAPAEKLTLDMVRAAAAPYIQTYGMTHAQTDLMDVLEKATGIRTISKLPADDQDVLAKACAAFKAAAQENPFKREAL